MTAASVPQRLAAVARALPGARPCVHALRVAWVQGSSELLDRWYRIRTTVLSGSFVPQFPDDRGYEPAKYPAIQICLREARLKADDVFFDIGCGMGRVLCMAARVPVKKCVGVEFRPDLAAIAERNAQRLRGRRSPVQILVGDAAEVDYSEGTVFFLYNPFGEATMTRFIDRLERSLHQRPRPIRIIYMAPHQQHVLRQRRWLAETLTLPVPYHVKAWTRAMFWENTSDFTAVGAIATHQEDIIHAQPS